MKHQKSNFFHYEILTPHPFFLFFMRFNFSFLEVLNSRTIVCLLIFSRLSFPYMEFSFNSNNWKSYCFLDVLFFVFLLLQCLNGNFFKFKSMFQERYVVET